MGIPVIIGSRDWDISLSLVRGDRHVDIPRKAPCAGAEICSVFGDRECNLHCDRDRSSSKCGILTKKWHGLDLKIPLCFGGIFILF